MPQIDPRPGQGDEHKKGQEYQRNKDGHGLLSVGATLPSSSARRWLVNGFCK